MAPARSAGLETKNMNRFLQYLPKLGREALVCMFSMALSPAIAFLYYFYFEQMAAAMAIAGLILVAFATGALQATLFGGRSYKAIGAGAFLGASVLWMPVVVVTYGFALLGLPLLAAYAAVVALGAKTMGAPQAPRQA
jgi:hypothetical protein